MYEVDGGPSSVYDTPRPAKESELRPQAMRAMGMAAKHDASLLSKQSAFPTRATLANLRDLTSNVERQIALSILNQYSARFIAGATGRVSSCTITLPNTISLSSQYPSHDKTTLMCEIIKELKSLGYEQFEVASNYMSVTVYW